MGIKSSHSESHSYYYHDSRESILLIGFRIRVTLAYARQLRLLRYTHLLLRDIIIEGELWKSGRRI